MSESKLFCKEADNYPQDLLGKRQAVEANIVGCLWKDPLLFEEVKLCNQDFLTHDGRYYFAVGQNLVKRGFNVLDEPTIISNSTQSITDLFYEKGGIDSISSISDIIDIRNFETYLDTLNRENVILKLYDRDFGVQKHLAKLRKMTCEEVLTFYENKLGEIDVSGIDNVEEDDLSIDDDFIQSCLEGAENGSPFDFAGEDIEGNPIKVLPGICNDIQGYMHGTLNMIAGHSSTGKSSLYINVISSLVYNGEKVLIISNEQKAKPFKLAFLCWIITQHFRHWGINKKKVMSGKLDEKDLEMIKKAKEYWNTHYKDNIRFIGIPDANMNVVKKKIRQAALKDGFTCFLYDTLKIEVGNGKDNFWLDMILDSRVLHSLASKYNMIGLCSIQLASNSIGQLFLNESCLSTSKQVIEIMESCLMLRNMFAEELDEKSKYYCKPFRREKDEKTGKWMEKKYELPLDGTYKMVFLTKCRNGENSNASGVARILRFFGGNGIFQEVCLCKPKNAVLGRR